MDEFFLNRQQRDAISPDELAMLILRLLQRNELIKNEGRPTNISYYHFQLSSLLHYEIFPSAERHSFGIEGPFEYKFHEAVSILKTRGFIMQDPSQRHSDDFQVPTTKGREVNTTTPVLGITSCDKFVGSIESGTGPLDHVAKTYIVESYKAAEHDLWLSSIFMLGAAAERLIYVLADHIDSLLKDPAATAALSKVESVRQRKEWIIAQLPTLRKSFSAHRNAFIDVEDKFDSLYNTFRYQRNGAGHPRETPFVPDVTQSKAILLSFGLYCQAVYAILAVA